MRVPGTGRAVDRQGTPERRGSVGQTAESGSCFDRRTADPVIDDRDQDSVATPLDLDADLGGRGVLHRVRDALGTDEVRGGRQAVREIGRIHVEVEPALEAGTELGQRLLEAGVAQVGGPEAGRQRSQARHEALGPRPASIDGGSDRGISVGGVRRRATARAPSGWPQHRARAVVRGRSAGRPRRTAAAIATPGARLPRFAGRHAGARCSPRVALPFRSTA